MDVRKIKARIKWLEDKRAELEQNLVKPSEMQRVEKEIECLTAALPYLATIEDSSLSNEKLIDKMLTKLKHDGMILYDRCDMKNFIESFKNKSL